MEDCDCGYCGRCREQYQYEVDTQDDSYYNEDDSDKEQQVYYWRV